MGTFIQLIGNCLLVAAVLFLSLRLYHIKKQVKHISRQLESFACNMVSVGLFDKDIVGMTVKINNLIEKMRQIKSDALIRRHCQIF